MEKFILYAVSNSIYEYIFFLLKFLAIQIKLIKKYLPSTQNFSPNFISNNKQVQVN